MHGNSEANLPRTARRTPIVLIRPPSAPSDPSPGSAPCRGCCSRTPFRLLLLLPCLLLLRRRPGPRRACRASSLRSYPRTRGRSSFGNCAAGTTGSAVRFRESRGAPSDLTKARGRKNGARWRVRGISGHSQRDDEVDDAPEHVREYARTPYRAPVDHRACRIGFGRASVRG